MDVDSPKAKSTPTGANGLNGLGRHVNGISTTAKVTDVISTFRPTKVLIQLTAAVTPFTYFASSCFVVKRMTRPLQYYRSTSMIPVSFS